MKNFRKDKRERPRHGRMGVPTPLVPPCHHDPHAVPVGWCGLAPSATRNRGRTRTDPQNISRKHINTCKFCQKPMDKSNILIDLVISARKDFFRWYRHKPRSNRRDEAPGSGRDPPVVLPHPVPTPEGSCGTGCPTPCPS